MSNLDQVWGATSADAGNTEDNVPPAGYVGVPRVSDVRTGTSKKGESYFLVELTDDTVSPAYKWVIYKQFTKGGQPHEGSIKSAKITLRQLGLDVPSPAQLEPALKTLIGRYFAVEQRASDRISQATGMPFVNTEVTGPASAPTMPQQQAPAQPVQAPAVQAPPVGAQPGAPTFPAAVPGGAPTVVGTPEQQAQAAAAAANYGDNPGW